MTATVALLAFVLGVLAGTQPWGAITVGLAAAAWCSWWVVTLERPHPGRWWGAP